MRTYYSDYVQHCMKFYARHANPVFRSSADKLNWYACDNALNGFTNVERELLLSIYRECDTLPDNVYKVSVANDIKQDKLWALIKKLEQRIAKRRNLI